MHDERDLIEARVRRALFERILPAAHTPAIPLTLTAWTAPGEPVPFAAAMRQQFSPFAAGTKWARPWGTTWFRMEATVPADWPEPDATRTIEAVIDLGFQGINPGFQSEGMVWNADGTPRGGVHPDRRAVTLDDARPGSSVELVLEAAANPGIASPVTPMGAWDTAGEQGLYTFRRADLTVRNEVVADLFRDVEVLLALAGTLHRDDARRHRILRTLDRAFDRLDLDDVPATAAEVRAVLAPALALPARSGVHQVVAVGHAHIDTAWLWPMRETVRKCARTFSSAVDLIERDPDFVFVCSQAQQYAWMEEGYPALFARIRDHVASRRFVPVGGMWVEADMNLPSGESIARQLVHGQRYFESRFGVRCREVWIPDVFGYPGSLPQIFAAGGCDRFVTQKLSWNKQNRMPHHTFRWTGIDGTSVLSHFPPVDTYNATVTPTELAYAAKNFRDDAWSGWSLLPYGHGDGGGGPTREMVARGRRLADLDGVPRVHFGTVDDFFAHVEEDIAADPDAVSEWRGELYFEMHRGTFTSQTRTKVGNREAERMLREVELWDAYLPDDPERRAAFDSLWKRVLCLQFHDILPGSSIAWVHADTEREHAAINAELEAMLAAVFGGLLPPEATVANAATHARDEIVESPLPPTGDGAVQRTGAGRFAFRVQVPGLGLTTAIAHEVADAVEVDRNSMRNACVEIEWDSAGQLVSLRDRHRDRECLPAGSRGAVIELAPDFPNEYDAWDLERWARRDPTVIDRCEAIEVIDAGPLVGRVRVTRTFGPSRVSHTYVIRAGSARVDLEFDIDWHHREHLLSVAFPIDVGAEVAHCDIQFGAVARPTHANTTWDAAKFEVCAHRWVTLTEPDFGVAVLNAGRYGHAVHRQPGAHGGIRVSLQRGARYPDPLADAGHHEVVLALLPHGGRLDEVAREAEVLNVPLRVARGDGQGRTLPAPIVTIDDPSVLVSALKRADDGDGHVLRAWEATGRRATLRSLPDARRRANLLEEVRGDAESGPVELRPFELVTWRLP